MLLFWGNVVVNRLPLPKDVGYAIKIGSKQTVDDGSPVNLQQIVFFRNHWDQPRPSGSVDRCWGFWFIFTKFDRLKGGAVELLWCRNKATKKKQSIDQIWGLLYWCYVIDIKQQLIAMSKRKECTTNMIRERSIWAQRNKSSKVGALDSGYQKPSDCWDQLRCLGGLSLSAKCYTLRWFWWTNFGTSFDTERKYSKSFMASHSNSSSESVNQFLFS